MTEIDNQLAMHQYQSPDFVAYEPDERDLEDEPDEPLDPRVYLTLQRDFGHDTLRDGQEQVIRRVLAGTDTLAIMPTGAGKSLTYQLPTMLLPGVTLVISPLIALMKDQLESLPTAVRARSTLINSSLSQAETEREMIRINRGETRLVFVAPERFRNHRFLRALQSLEISLAVVDEAHCISMWGADFRPDYLFIPKALAELGDPPVLALTATATGRMAAEIGQGLGRDLERVQVSTFRPNLFYSVRRLRNREEKVSQLVEICKQLPGSGIVYVSSRKDAELLASTLRDRGVMAVPYHAGLDANIRAQNHERFMSGQARVVVATVAFGMGIDKADVRFVIHFAAPASLEAYAQESGRAGRDGERADCILLGTSGDGTRLKAFARREEMQIDDLREVYAAIKRATIGDWALLDARRMEEQFAGEDEEDGVDIKVAIGILERAELLTRHPDAPANYSLSRFAKVDPEVIRQMPQAVWQWLDSLALPTTIQTAEVCSLLGITPFELDRWLNEDEGLQLRSGYRALAIHLLPAPAGSGQRIESLLEQSRAANEYRIDQIVGYINGHSCRHVQLARHLGEQLEPCESSCDLCTGTATAKSTKDETLSRFSAADAEIVLRAIDTLPFEMGKSGLTRLLLGSTESKVRSDRSSAFGTLAHLSKGTVDRLIEKLIEQGYLFRNIAHEYRLISLTAKGRTAGADDLAAIAMSAPRSQPAEFESGTLAARRYAALSDWRMTMVRQEQKPAYVFATNAVLKAISEQPPETIEALAKIPGFGMTRAENYGEGIFAALESVD